MTITFTKENAAQYAFCAKGWSDRSKTGGHYFEKATGNRITPATDEQGELLGDMVFIPQTFCKACLLKMTPETRAIVLKRDPAARALFAKSVSTEPSRP